MVHNRKTKRSGRIHDFIDGFWLGILGDPKPLDLVQIKMKHPQRKLRRWQIVELRRKIRLSLMDNYGYSIGSNGKMVKPKPRIRHRLKRYRLWDWKAKTFIGVYQCLIVLFFLSFGPVGATTYASSSGTWNDIRYADGNWLHPDRAAWVRPEVANKYSTFEVRHPPIRFIIRSKRQFANEFVYNSYLRMLETPIAENAVLNQTKPEARNWRKFVLTLSVFGTILFLIGFFLLHGHWRSTR